MKNLTLGVAAAMMTAGVAFAQTTTPGTATTPPTTTQTAPMAAPGTPVTPVTPRTPVNPASPSAPLNPSNNSSTTPPAVTTSAANNKTSAAPVKGRNSFTIGEARRRITAGGFTKVTGLRKDRDGIWRGKAMKDGASVSVYCDYQGNVGSM